MYAPVTDTRFIAMGRPRRIWAVSAVNGEAGRLANVHDGLAARISPGDRIVYHGNYTGFGPRAAETIDEILTFRRYALAQPGMKPEDFIYLRGAHEEMWEKLIQLPFAPRPADVFIWMLGNGMSSALASYGLSAQEGLRAAQEGVMPLTRWIRRVRETIRKWRGHEIFSTQLRRAAFTDEQSQNPLLFVNAGIDPTRPLNEQGDSFWWSKKNFNSITIPFNPFAKVIRGYDPKHGGVHINCVTATIDGGCGFGGSLICAGFDEEGSVFDIIEN